MTTIKQPTLEEFRASRKEMTWHDAAKLLQIDEAYTDAPRALVYMNSVFIEDYNKLNYPHKTGWQGQYVLVVNRDVRYSDDILTLEQILYEYMMDYEDGF